MSRCNLDIKPLDLELLNHFGYHVYKSRSKLLNLIALLTI